MDRFTTTDLRRLIETKEDPLVSLYMPTIRSGREVQQNPVRFKNLLKQVEEQLKEYGMKAQQVQRILRGPSELLTDEPWWQHQSDGLAMFLAGDRTDSFRVPLGVEETVVVGPRFHVRPMLPLLQEDGTFYVLAASQNRVRLLVGTRFSVDELDPDELPRDLRSALNIDEYTSSLQHHASGFLSEPGTNIFHGHGASDMDVRKKDELLRFFQRVASALETYLSDERVPLVFAGVDYLFPLFREATHYKHLVKEPATGNPDDLSVRQLHELAWSKVAPTFAGERREALGKYEESVGNQRVAAAVPEVVRASRQGAVDTLFIADNEKRWGILEETSDDVVLTDGPGEGAEELLNYSAIRTLLAGGKVYSLPAEEVPAHEPAAAVLRFPLA